MKAWRWHCTTHSLDLLTMQTGANPPTTCNAFANIVWPDTGPCWFQGTPVLHMFPNPAPDPQSPGWERRAEQRRGIPLPPSVPARHNSPLIATKGATFG